MSRILISLLGTTLNEASYLFPNNVTPIVRRYCALAIVEDLRLRGERVDELVVIGTTGSCWHQLADVALGDPNPFPDERAALAAAEKADTVASSTLAPWETRMAEALAQQYSIGSLKLVPIGYTDTQDSQIALIRLMGELVGDAEYITFDLTHSLRHISMFGLMAAVIIKQLKKVPIEVHYGAFELSRKRSDGCSPVMRLDSLSTMLDYLSALGAYDKDGDYGVLAPVLERDTGDRKTANLLLTAAFNEYAGNFGAASQNIRKLQDALGGIDESATFSIFKDELQLRFEWAADSELYGRQRQHAHNALGRGDLVRAALWGVVALETWLLFAIEEDAADQSVRNRYFGPGQKERDHLGKLFVQAGVIDRLNTFLLLKEVRNRFAHAYQISEDQNKEVGAILATRRSCETFLRKAFDELLP